MAITKVLPNNNKIWSIDENSLKQPPAPIDILDTKILLEDFYIFEDIPTFPSLMKLLNWRIQIIKKSL